jgi:hypothetical protein
MLAEVVAMRQDNEAATERFEARRGEAVRELKDAEKAYEGAKQGAREAMSDEASLREFVSTQGGAPAPAVAAPSAPPVPAKCEGDCSAAVRVWRPSADSAEFVVEATRRYGEDAIPYPDAELTLTWEGYDEDYIADASGKARVDPVFLRERWPDKAEKVKLQAELAGKTHAVSVSLPELEHYIDDGAALLAAQGEAAARAGRHEEAARKFWTSLSWKRSEKAVDGWVAAVERLDKGRARTLSAYRAALLGRAMDPKTRFEFKRKAVRLAKESKPAPAVPREAVEYVRQAIASFKAGAPARALGEAETAASLAPWWAEPCFPMAKIYEHMTVHKSFAYASAAIENYDLFLEAAPPGDARVSEAKKDRDRLKSLQAAMQ